MSYTFTNSSNMGSYVYNKNYNMGYASESTKQQNIETLKKILPYDEHHNIDLYIDPGGNISRNLMGQLSPDINKILDKTSKK